MNKMWEEFFLTEKPYIDFEPGVYDEVAAKVAQNFKMSDLKRLGAGQYGVAYHIGDLVIKVTTMKHEASAAVILQHARHPYIYKVHKVFKLPTNKNKSGAIQDLWVIIYDYTQQLPEKAKEIVNLLIPGRVKQSMFFADDESKLLQALHYLNVALQKMEEQGKLHRDIHDFMDQEVYALGLTPEISKIFTIIKIALGINNDTGPGKNKKVYEFLQDKKNYAMTEANIKAWKEKVQHIAEASDFLKDHGIDYIDYHGDNIGLDKNNNFVLRDIFSAWNNQIFSAPPQTI